MITRIAITVLIVLSSAISFASGNIWNQKANIPAEGRHRTVGFSIGNKGYIGLGHYNSGPNGNIVKGDIWEYSPNNDSWTQKADYGGGPTYGASSFVIENIAYVGAHVYGGTEFFSFDALSNTWTPIANMPVSSSDQTAFAVDGKGYYVTSNSIFEYDPLLDTWSPAALTPGSVSSWSKSFTIDGKGYILANGGILYEFKPSTSQFVVRAPFPGEATAGWSTFSINGKGYVVSGYASWLSNTSRQCWEYNSMTNSWAQLDDLPGATRRFSSSFSIGNKGYISTGTNGTNMNDLWEFDLLLSGTEDLDAVEISVYPNPSIEEIQFTINSTSSEQLELSIYTLDGRTVSHSVFTGQSIKIHKSEIGIGSFIYRIHEGSETKKNGKIIFT